MLTTCSPSLPAPPMALEPGMVALEIFDHVPSWAIVHAARDDSTAPLIMAGEIAIVESSGVRGGIIPERGALYLIEWVSPPSVYTQLRECRTRAIVQAREHQKGGWYASPYRSRVGNRIFCADGPYRDKLDLGEKLLGRVVGIYGPSRRGAH